MMSKRWIWWLALVCCSGIAGLVLAESAEWDADAVKSMSKAERLAYQQAYKAELEGAARERGWVPGEKRAFEGAGRQAGPPRKAAGSITYHSGALGTCCLSSRTVGNQFDFALNPASTAISPVMMSGSITMATFNMIAVGGGAAIFSFYDNQAGTGANFLGSIGVPAVTGTNTATFTPALTYSGSTFLAGIWQFTIGTDTPAVATGTVGGQGFHGMSINDIVATGFTTLPTLNAAMSISGNVLTPVELLNFEVE